MKIKNEEDLMNILGNAFATYANRVQNGAVAPYKDFLDGVESVVVTVELKEDGKINVKPFVQETSAQPETAEAQVETVVEVPTVEPIVEEIAPVEEEQPKRRKKKTE